MYIWVIVAIVLAAFLLVHYKPMDLPGNSSAFGAEVGSEIEGFTSVVIHPTRMPECVARSTDAQALLARIANVEGDEADELRLLVSKICCMEADIAAPSAGKYRTQHIQFRTSHDLEPPSSLVGRCLRNAVNKRDIELIVEKFASRGHVLVKNLCTDASASKELDAVVARLQMSMMSFCLKESPVMDRPGGPRDLGFWESEEVDLPQYQGVSAEPR